MSSNRQVVLGASGGAGRAIVQALAERGHEVRAVSRSIDEASAPGVEAFRADITDTVSVTEAIDGARVVYMAAQPAYHRWPEEFPRMLSSVIDGVVRSDARLVMVGNLYVYGPSPAPMSEPSPTSAATKKGRVRIQMAEMVEDAAASRGLRATIGRASDYFGPGADNSTITALAVAPAMAGKPIKWMGRLDKRHSVAYLPDIARAYAILGEHDEADGQDWILPHGPAPTGGEFLVAVNQALPAAVKTGSISKAMLMMAAPFHRRSRESLEMMYQWTDDFVVDDSKFQDAFGPFTTTPLDDAVVETFTWNRSYNHG